MFVSDKLLQICKEKISFISILNVEEMEDIYFELFELILNEIENASPNSFAHQDLVIISIRRSDYLLLSISYVLQKENNPNLQKLGLYLKNKKFSELYYHIKNVQSKFQN